MSADLEGGCRRSNFHRVSAAGVKALAHDGVQIFAEASFDRREVVSSTTQKNAALREVWVGFGEYLKNGIGCETDLVVDVLEGGWDFEGVKGFVFHGEETLRANG